MSFGFDATEWGTMSPTCICTNDTGEHRCVKCGKGVCQGCGINDFSTCFEWACKICPDSKKTLTVSKDLSQPQNITTMDIVKDTSEDRTLSPGRNSNETEEEVKAAARRYLGSQLDGQSPKPDSEANELKDYIENEESGSFKGKLGNEEEDLRTIPDRMPSLEHDDADSKTIRIPTKAANIYQAQQLPKRSGHAKDYNSSPEVHKIVLNKGARGAHNKEQLASRERSDNSHSNGGLNSLKTKSRPAHSRPSTAIPTVSPLNSSQDFEKHKQKILASRTTMRIPINPSGAKRMHNLQQSKQNIVSRIVLNTGSRKRKPAVEIPSNVFQMRVSQVTQSAPTTNSKLIRSSVSMPVICVRRPVPNDDFEKGTLYNCLAPRSETFSHPRFCVRRSQGFDSSVVRNATHPSAPQDALAPYQQQQQQAQKQAQQHRQQQQKRQQQNPPEIPQSQARRPVTCVLDWKSLKPRVQASSSRVPIPNDTRASAHRSMTPGPNMYSYHANAPAVVGIQTSQVRPRNEARQSPASVVSGGQPSQDHVSPQTWNALHAIVPVHGSPSFGYTWSHQSFEARQIYPSGKHVQIKQKRFACPHCGKRFMQKSNMIAHTRIHTGERPFKCDKCARAFAQKSNLKRHQQIHTRKGAVGVIKNCGANGTDAPSSAKSTPTFSSPNVQIRPLTEQKTPQLVS
mmetsp:Transcript_22361/g.31315  ORF Transcript_22361/g.31315 Transcript_22361/m.31315 type:complete len:682 (-) Transcript_22361:824-2869(-)